MQQENMQNKGNDVEKLKLVGLVLQKEKICVGIKF